jgi:hypothetical protein
VAGAVLVAAGVAENVVAIARVAVVAAAAAARRACCGRVGDGVAAGRELCAAVADGATRVDIPAPATTRDGGGDMAARAPARTPSTASTASSPVSALCRAGQDCPGRLSGPDGNGSGPGAARAGDTAVPPAGVWYSGVHRSGWNCCPGRVSWPSGGVFGPTGEGSGTGSSGRPDSSWP